MFSQKKAFGHNNTAAWSFLPCLQCLFCDRPSPTSPNTLTAFHCFVVQISNNVYTTMWMCEWVDDIHVSEWQMEAGGRRFCMLYNKSMMNVEWKSQNANFISIIVSEVMSAGRHHGRSRLGVHGIWGLKFVS